MPSILSFCAQSLNLPCKNIKSEKVISICLIASQPARLYLQVRVNSLVWLRLILLFKTVDMASNTTLEPEVKREAVSETEQLKIVYTFLGFVVTLNIVIICLAIARSLYYNHMEGSTSNTYLFESAILNAPQPSDLDNEFPIENNRVETDSSDSDEMNRFTLENVMIVVQASVHADPGDDEVLETGV